MDIGTHDEVPKDMSSLDERLLALKKRDETLRRAEKEMMSVKMHKMNEDVLNRLTQKYRLDKDGKDIFYDSFVGENGSIEKTMMIPVKVLGEIEHLLAQKVAEEYGMRFTIYDFSKQTKEHISDCRPVFSFIVPNTKIECERKFDHLIAARKKLIEIFENLVTQITDTFLFKEMEV